MKNQQQKITKVQGTDVTIKKIMLLVKKQKSIIYWCLMINLVMLSFQSYSQILFMKGINTWGTSAGNVAALTELGITWHAPFLKWSDVEPVITQKDLTVSQVTSAMIDQYIASHDWSKFDNVVNTIVQNNWKPFPVIGQLFTSTVPQWQGKPIVPDIVDATDNPAGIPVSVVGRDNFLGHIYLHLRAVVRRYKDKVDYWMIDPEINQAALFRLFGGWKVGKGWEDWNWVTQVVQTLSKGIKDEDSYAYVCLPFNTDQPPAVTFYYAHSPFLGGGDVTVKDWPDAITDWLPYIDIVGIDFFESQGNPNENCYQRIKDRVTTAVTKAAGKPVVITSIGCPSGSSALSWSEAKQNTYISQAFSASVDAGAAGFFYFEIKTAESSGVVITPQDIDILNHAETCLNNAWYQDEYQFGISFGDFLLWTANTYFSGNINNAITYFKTTFFNVLETSEAYWGLVRADGSYKPSFNSLKVEYAKFRLSTGLPNQVLIPSKLNTQNSGYLL
ncbi:MAG: hypothetical protein HY738_04630 [Bacteroidia bacterium]|nr:hypothetical protein [Bacteroidia bacterium]